MLGLRSSKIIYIIKEGIGSVGWLVGMAKYDGIRGQELMDVEEKEDELILIFKDNRYLFIRVENGRLVTESVPE